MPGDKAIPEARFACPLKMNCYRRTVPMGKRQIVDVHGVEENAPILSDMVDNQLRDVQKQIEDYSVSHRQSTFESIASSTVS